MKTEITSLRSLDTWSKGDRQQESPEISSVNLHLFKLTRKYQTEKNMKLSWQRYLYFYLITIHCSFSELWEKAYAISVIAKMCLESHKERKHIFFNIPTKLPTLLCNVTSVLFVSEIKHTYMCILTTLAFSKRNKKKSAETEMNIGRGTY